MRRVRRLLDAAYPTPAGWTAGAQAGGGRVDLHCGNNFLGDLYGEVSPALQFMGLFPYVDSVWLGEGASYELGPAYWLVEVSGLAFGQAGDTMRDQNSFRSMLFGMAPRPSTGNPRSLWRLWDALNLGGGPAAAGAHNVAEQLPAPPAVTFGWWEEDPLAVLVCGGVTSQQVLATVFAVPAAVAPPTAHPPVGNGRGWAPHRHNHTAGRPRPQPLGHALIVIASWASTEQLCELRLDWSRLGPLLGIAHPPGPATPVGMRADAAAGSGDIAGGARLWAPVIAGVQPGIPPLPLQWVERGAAAADAAAAAGQGAPGDQGADGTGPGQSIPDGSILGRSILGPGAGRQPAVALRSAALRVDPAAGVMLLLDIPDLSHPIAPEAGGAPIADAVPARAAAAPTEAEGEGGAAGAGQEDRWPPVGTSAPVRRWQEEEVDEVEAAQVELEASEAAAAASAAMWFTPPTGSDAAGAEGEERDGGVGVETQGGGAAEWPMAGGGAWLIPD
eukprot:scaffold8301_cov122-Isochrysis_galbana.AAC.1